MARPLSFSIICQRQSNVLTRHQYLGTFAIVRMNRLPKLVTGAQPPAVCSPRQSPVWSLRHICGTYAARYFAVAQARHGTFVHAARWMPSAGSAAAGEGKIAGSSCDYALRHTAVDSRVRERPPPTSGDAGVTSLEPGRIGGWRRDPSPMR